MELKTILNTERQIIVQLEGSFKQHKWYMTQNSLFLATSLGTRSEKSIRDSITRKKEGGLKKWLKTNEMVFRPPYYWRTRRSEGVGMTLLKERWLYTNLEAAMWKGFIFMTLLREYVCESLSTLLLQIYSCNKEKHPSIQRFSLEPVQDASEWVQQTSTP